MNQTTSARVCIKQRLRALGLRPTRQRVAIARLLLDGGDRHLNAEDLLSEARAAGICIAQTSIYNILRQFARVGLVREVLVEPGRTWFDTRIGPHVHLYNEDSGEISDLEYDPESLGLLDDIDLPADVAVSDVSVVIRVSTKDK